MVANPSVRLILLILRCAAIKCVFCLRAEKRFNGSLYASLLLVRKNAEDLVNNML